MAKGRVIGFLFGSLVGGVVAGGTTYGLMSRGPVAEPSAPRGTYVEVEPFEPRRLDGITAPAAIVTADREKVADALVAVAGFQERFYERQRTFASLEKIPRTPEVSVTYAVVQPTAYCVEAVHIDTPGTRLRLISVTGEIDSGTCDGRRPLEEQVGTDRAAQSGGHLEVTGVRAVALPPAESDGAMGHRYGILVDARWEGPGMPVLQLCEYTMYDVTGAAFYEGGWMFTPEALVLDDYEGVPVYSTSDLKGKVPVDIEMACRDRH